MISEAAMNTRKPKANLLYAIEPPTQWLQVVTAVPEQDSAASCRKQWQCRQGAVAEPTPAPRKVQLH